MSNQNEKSKFRNLVSPMIIAVLVIPALFLYQNCSKVGVQVADLAAVEKFTATSCSDVNSVGCEIKTAVCEFNGLEIADGGSALAFLTSSVEEGSLCLSETRLCQSGALSGSFNYESCQVNIKKSCLFDGLEIKHGDFAEAFANSTVGFGESCASEKRLCSDGSLSGNYRFGSCEVGTALACFHNGQTIKHLESAIAFADSSVPFGSSCSQESRTCFNGVMSGSFAYANCAVGAPKSCLYSGQTIAHGQSVDAFSPPTNNVCVKETRLCSNGVLSGTYTSPTCETVAAGPANGGNLCGQFRNVQGDMRVYIEPSKAADQDSILEFGTFADNYWEGSVRYGKLYSRKLTFDVENKSKIFSMILSQASFDDWLSIKVNGKAVYFGPKAGADRMVHDAVNGKVQYSATQSAVVELSTSWNKILTIDLVPYLVEGQNTIETDTIVAGGGESALKIKYRSDCSAQ